MDSARVATLTILCCGMAFLACLAMFMWGRESIADDCERYGKFYRGEHVFECSPSAEADLPR
jgi:hypothetical protein